MHVGTHSRPIHRSLLATAVASALLTTVELAQAQLEEVVVTAFAFTTEAAAPTEDAQLVAENEPISLPVDVEALRLQASLGAVVEGRAGERGHGCHLVVTLHDDPVFREVRQLYFAVSLLALVWAFEPGRWKIGMARDRISGIIDDAIVECAELDPSDVAEANDLSIIAGLNDNVLKLSLFGQTAKCVNAVLKGITTSGWILADDSCGDLNILLAKGGNDILRDHVE